MLFSVQLKGTLFKILGFHWGVVKDAGLLGCDDVLLG
jgi:hypothetical protein